MNAPAEVSTDDLLAELVSLADAIGEAEATAAKAYERRATIWSELTERKVDRGAIAEASGVGRSAVGFGLYKQRKTTAG